MNLKRKYIQFNDLVIDNFDMLASADLSGGFKTEGMEYSFGHGSYTPFKSKQQYSVEQEISMTLKLDTRKLSCEQVRHYKDFVTLNLVKPGRLWAIQGDQILWAFAYVKDFGESYEADRYAVNIDVDFILYEGFWHKADTRKVFLKPYDLCNYMDCLDFKVIDECQDCCASCKTVQNIPCKSCICDCEFLYEEYSLCSLKKEVAEAFYKRCGENYRIIYNCEAGKKIWGNEKMLGQKICKEDMSKGIVAGQFYSDTILDTDSAVITIHGALKNPTITINGNSLRIIGEYDGVLTITASGDVYYKPDGGCDNKLIPLDNLVIPDGSTFGFIVKHGNNSLILETNDCCSMTCVYVNVDGITI